VRVGQGNVHRVRVSPAEGAPATVRPPAENATSPAPNLLPVMVVMRLTRGGSVTFHRVTAVLPAMLVSVRPSAENASATSARRR
jgi:hypothetical protein